LGKICLFAADDNSSRIGKAYFIILFGKGVGMKFLGLLIASLLISSCAHQKSGTQKCTNNEGEAKACHQKKEECVKTKFDKIDKNKDGKLSKKEFTAHAEEKFKEMDTNKDKNVTMEEFKAFHEEGNKCSGEKCSGAKCVHPDGSAPAATPAPAAK
jgi:hypothetical protein